LPPKIEVEVFIHIIPRTVFIAQSLYRIVTTELEELKIQLEELLDKKLIQSSNSPWGASVLFVKKKDETFDFVLDTKN